jgi:hypothetical protein
MKTLVEKFMTHVMTGVQEAELTQSEILKSY